AKNSSDPLSADQNGHRTASVVAMWTVSFESKRRVASMVRPSRVVSTHASVDPSGDTNARPLTAGACGADGPAAATRTPRRPPPGGGGGGEGRNRGERAAPQRPPRGCPCWGRAPR